MTMKRFVIDALEEKLRHEPEVVDNDHGI